MQDLLIKTARKALANAVAIQEEGEDGALYLQKVTPLNILEQLHPRDEEKKQIVEDAITYKKVLYKYDN